MGSDIGDTVPPVQLVCTVDAFPEATITWSRGATLIESRTEGLTVSQSGSTSTLTVLMTDVSRRGIYTCRAVNKLGEASQDYKILAKSEAFCFT